MNHQQYEEFVREAWNATNTPEYTVIALAGEAGEVANAYKKHCLRVRGDRRHSAVNHVPDELGDLLYYLVRLAYEMDYSLEQIMRLNMEKLLERGMVEDPVVAQKFRELLDGEAEGS